MSSQTVHSLRYDVIANTQGFTKGMVATNKAINATKKVLRETATPMERYQAELAKINKLQKMGLLSTDAYNRKLKQLKTTFQTTSRSASLFKKSIGKLGIAAGAALAGMSARGAFAGFVDQIERLDKIAKSARGIGAGTEFLSGLEFVAQRTSGFASGQATKAIEKMTRRVAQAAEGMGEAQKALEKLGLTAIELRDAGPEETFHQISMAMRTIENDGERAALALKIFDDEQANIHTTMALTSTEYEKQIQLAKSLGQVLTETQAKQAEAAADDLQEARAGLDELKKELTLAAAPGASAWAGLIRGIRIGNINGGFLGRNAAQLADAGDRFDFNLRQKEEALAEKRRNQKIAETERKRTEAWSAFYASLGPAIINEMRAQSPFDAFGGNKPAAPPPGAGPTSRSVISSSDPAASIQAGSSASFRIQNRITSSRQVMEDSAKTTADSTSKTAELVGVLVEQNNNAVEVGL